jgi:SAM-dependent methyltransferase
MPAVINQRRAFIEERIDIREVRMLEIGAANLPTYNPAEADISFLDVQDTNELQTQYAGTRHRTAEGVVPIDFVIRPDAPMRDAVEGTFDLAMANHVVEHVTDVIGWLAQLSDVVKPGGHLMLAVPDRRYTFDYIRRETDALDLVGRYVRGEHGPDEETRLRNAYYYRPIRSEQVWAGDHYARARQRRFTLREALAFVRSGREKDADMHVHVFTCATFQSVLGELRAQELTSWEIVACRDVLEGGNEFLVLLRNRADTDPGWLRATGSAST